VTIDEKIERIRRGTAEIIVEAELRRKLERSARSGIPLKVKLGLDPTAPDLHLGHTVVLQKLRDFQDLGHEAIIIIGDFTAMIGDPSGRSETRPALSQAEIEANAQTYRVQLGRIVDMSRARVAFNSTWLAPLKLEDVIRLAARVTVAQMLQRDDFASRYAAGRPISLHEFVYPLCQAYDSLVGRDLQRAAGQEPQVAITTPILEGLDGAQKMSKSLGNYVGITEPPEEVYGKLMSLPDALMLRYFTLVTRLSGEEIQRMAADLDQGRLHPMEAKKRLARVVVEQYHGREAAGAAEAAFTLVFQRHGLPEEIEECRIPLAASKAPLPIIMREANLVPSSSEGRRQIRQGAVEVDGERVLQVDRELARGGSYLIRVGKRRFKRVLLE
jgi:tyrosyl-tRNA synthetase